MITGRALDLTKIMRIQIGAGAAWAGHMLIRYISYSDVHDFYILYTKYNIVYFFQILFTQTHTLPEIPVLLPCHLNV